jgi:hypothetical protein
MHEYLMNRSQIAEITTMLERAGLGPLKVLRSGALYVTAKMNIQQVKELAKHDIQVWLEQ